MENGVTREYFVPIHRRIQEPKNVDELLEAEKHPVRKRVRGPSQRKPNPPPPQDDLWSFKAINGGIYDAVKGAGNRLGQVVDDVGVRFHNIPQSGRLQHNPQLKELIPMAKPIVFRG